MPNEFCSLRSRILKMSETFVVGKGTILAFISSKNSNCLFERQWVVGRASILWAGMWMPGLGGSPQSCFPCQYQGPRYLSGYLLSCRACINEALPSLAEPRPWPGLLDVWASQELSVPVPHRIHFHFLDSVLMSVLYQKASILFGRLELHVNLIKLY